MLAVSLKALPLLDSDFPPLDLVLLVLSGILVQNLLMLSLPFCLMLSTQPIGWPRLLDLLMALGRRDTRKVGLSL